MTVGETVKLCLEEVRESNAATSQHTYRWHGRVAIEQWGAEKCLGEITKFEVQQWVYRLQNVQKVRPATIRHMLSFLNRLYRIAEDHGCLYNLPTCKLRLPRLNNKKKRVLLPEEETLLKQVMKPWHWAILQFYLNTGMRRIEVYRAKPPHVKIWVVGTVERKGKTVPVYEGELFIPESKTGRDRTVSLNCEACVIIRRWMSIAAEQGQKYIFAPYQKSRLGSAQYFAKHLRRACIVAGIEGVTPHTLRHTFASRAKAAGAHKEDIQVQLGHDSVVQTERYIHDITRSRVAVSVISRFGKVA